MKAILFAAGLGTRLKPWTDHHPKALALVNGKTLLERNVRFLQNAGVQDVIINIHHFPDQIKKAVDQNNGWGSRIVFSDESGEVLETGGGLKKAAWYFDGERDFVAINADILTDLPLATMIARHGASGDLATLAVSDRSSSRYFLFDESVSPGRLGGWENAGTGEKKLVINDRPLVRKAFSGVHVISTRMLPLIPQTGKFSLVDTYLSLAAGHRIGSFDHTGSLFVDVGKPESIALAENCFL